MIENRTTNHASDRQQEAAIDVQEARPGPTPLSAAASWS